MLGMSRLYAWQIDALEAVGRQGRGAKPVAITAANGSGKTSNLIAPLVLWFLDTYPRGQAIITSGSHRQIEKQLFPALRVHRRKFPGWTFLTNEIRTPEGGFALGFSTDDPGRAEGWHPKVHPSIDPVFIIVDEAKTVPETVFQALDRCTRTYQLWVSSPGSPRGPFYDAFRRNASRHFLRCVPSDACPHIDPAKRARDLERYGIDHPVYRSMHLAEFTEAIDRFILPALTLSYALANPPAENLSGETVAFCDFAAGRDENVLAIRRGNVVRIDKAWTEKNTMQAAREFVHRFQVNGLQPGQVWGDADGLGTVMIDAIAELGFHLHRFHGGKPATDPKSYASLISETWHHGAREIERGRIHAAPMDPETFQQLSTRRSEWTLDGKLRIESKETLARQGIHSPDRADALLGAIACGARLSGAVTAEMASAAYIPESGFATVNIVDW
jgi:hypothetical protein